MAAKPENQARTAINKLVPHAVHREKMGTGFAAGTADQWYSGYPHDLWIEYKFLPKPPTRLFTLDLTTLQLQWLEKRYEEGRAVCVVLCFPAKYGCWLFTHLGWVGQIDPSTCTTLTRAQVAQFITRSCTENASHSALVRRRESD